MIREMTTRELAELIRTGSGFLLVDVLPREQHAREHIPGARNVPLSDGDFVSSVAAAIAGDPESPIIVYGADESCDESMQAAGELQGAGFTNVFDYRGGLEAWRRTERTDRFGALPDRMPRTFTAPRRSRQTEKATLARSALRVGADPGASRATRSNPRRDARQAR